MSRTYLRGDLYYAELGHGIGSEQKGTRPVVIIQNNVGNSMIKGLVKKYNKQHKEQLPNITPHSLRHTFCTRMANAGMNPKALQYIMGYANITMTLDYYTHVDACSVKAEMERLAA